MIGNYWLLRHPALPGKVCAIPEAEVENTPSLLDLPMSGMTFENIEIIPLEEFLARVKVA